MVLFDLIILICGSLRVLHNIFLNRRYTSVVGVPISVVSPSTCEYTQNRNDTVFWVQLGREELFTDSFNQVLFYQRLKFHPEPPTSVWS